MPVPASLLTALDRFPTMRRRGEVLVNRRLPAFVPFTPSYIQVEVINRCNLACVMCPIVDLSRARPRRALDASVFVSIVEQLPALRRVDLQGIGEPLLNPHIEAIVAASRARGLEVGFVTNGLLLDEVRAERLLRAGLTHIVFSVDSVDPGVFASIRSGADVGHLLDRIGMFLASRRRLGATTHVGMMSVAMTLNLESLPDVVSTAAALGVDELTIKGLNPFARPDLQEREPAEALRRIREAAAAHTGLRVVIACENDHSILRCRWPWTAAYVTAEGDVTPCCNCPDSRRVNLGNLFEKPFVQIWNAPAYRRFRRELRTGVPEICRSCPDY